ncbi:MAG: hypothetical protein ACLP9L_15775 [Thermoguttaceae bacterium]
MKKIVLWAAALVVGLAFTVIAAEAPAPAMSAAGPKFYEWAPTPPMGWNSWDAFGSSVKEEQVLANADYMDRYLKPHGWNLITIDIQWYEPTAQRDQYRRGAALEMDANGRLLPAPNRFPMTKDIHSFKPMADYLHAKNLKFGLHLMRGIPRQAVDRDNVTILDKNYKAADIVNKQNSCRWNQDMYGVDMTKPGAQEYYDSVYKLFAEWGLDFVKVDDFARQRPEIEAIRKAIDKCGRPIVLSVSMGSLATEGPHISANANMWRVSFDFWDNWQSLYAQFNNLNSHQPYQGVGHWPDADMLPFGRVKTWEVPAHYSKFTHDEQYTVMTLWSIARSPLINGSNMPDNDAFTMALMTNDEVIAVDQKSTNNKQLFRKKDQIAWIADVPDSKDKYLAIFNAVPAPPPGRGRGPGGFGGFGGPGGPGAPGGQAARTATAPAPAATTPAPPINSADLQPAVISVSLAEMGLSSPCTVRDLWAHKDLGEVKDTVSATVNSHGAVMYRIAPVQASQPVDNSKPSDLNIPGATGFPGGASGTSADDSKPSRWNIPGRQYPRVDSESRCTFRLTAPNAQTVRLHLDKDYDMVRDAQGVWSATTGPQAPGFHYYWFMLDGVNVCDPASETFFGVGRRYSGIEVPDKGVDFYDAKNVPTAKSAPSGTIPSSPTPGGDVWSTPHRITTPTRALVIPCFISNTVWVKTSPDGPRRGG